MFSELIAPAYFESNLASLFAVIQHTMGPSNSVWSCAHADGTPYVLNAEYWRERWCKVLA